MNAPVLTRRRREDNPTTHASQFVFSLIWGGLITGAGIALRVFHLIGEATLMVIVLAGGIAIQGHSLLSFAKTLRKAKPEEDA